MEPEIFGKPTRPVSSLMKTLFTNPKLARVHLITPNSKRCLTSRLEGRFTGIKPSGRGIAIVGDSHAMGWGVNDEETFAAVLQRIANRPVYNLGVGSYATERELIRLEKSGLLNQVDPSFWPITVVIWKRTNSSNAPVQQKTKPSFLSLRKLGPRNQLPLLIK